MQLIITAATSARRPCRTDCQLEVTMTITPGTRLAMPGNRGSADTPSLRGDLRAPLPSRRRKCRSTPWFRLRCRRCSCRFPTTVQPADINSCWPSARETGDVAVVEHPDRDRRRVGGPARRVGQRTWCRRGSPRSAPGRSGGRRRAAAAGGRGGRRGSCTVGGGLRPNRNRPSGRRTRDPRTEIARAISTIARARSGGPDGSGFGVLTTSTLATGVRRTR